MVYMDIKILMSCLLGVLTGMYLINYYKQEYHGPDSNLVKKQLYQLESGECFRYEAIPHICPL